MMIFRTTRKLSLVISICVAMLLIAAPISVPAAYAKPAWKDSASHPGKGRKKQSSAQEPEPIIVQEPEPIIVQEPEPIIVQEPEPINSAPVIDGSPAGMATVGEFYDFVPLASDPDGDKVEFSIANQPDWADFDPISGALFGTPDDLNIGTFNGIQIIASDGQDATALQSFSILVEPAPLRSVTVNWQPPLQNEDGSQLEDLAGYRIYSVAADGSLSQLAELTNIGLTSHFVDGLMPGVWSLAMTAMNAAGLESELSNAVLFDLR